MNNTKIQITQAERQLLTNIAESEYHDGSDPVGNPVWMDYLVDTKSLGGVLTSLQKKGLVGVNLVPLSKSDNAQAGVTDSTIWITEAGAEALA